MAVYYMIWVKVNGKRNFHKCISYQQMQMQLKSTHRDMFFELCSHPYTLATQTIHLIAVTCIHVLCLLPHKKHSDVLRVGILVNEHRFLRRLDTA